MVIVILLNYLVGWVVAYLLSRDTLRELYALSKEEAGPENSAQIKEKVKVVLDPMLLPTLALGMLGFVACAIFFTCQKLWWEATDTYEMWMEIARRYQKAKRGHGVKPSLSDDELELMLLKEHDEEEHRLRQS